jgi:hypothetical protein
MKKSLFFIMSNCCLYLVASCGGGNSTPIPHITMSVSPTASLALDVNQSAPITANVSNDPSNQGFDWALTCGGGNCGTITAHTASGAPATFNAPAAPPSVAVTITAKLTGLTNSVSTTVMVSTPPTVAMTGSITAATLSTPYSLQLAANGGAGALTWALGGGTSLPDTLSLSGTGMISGTPTGTSGTFNFKVHVKDSGNPQLTSPDAQLSIAVAAPPISVTLSQSSAFVALNGSTKFIATLTNDQPNGNVDWMLTLNGMACPVAECGSVSPITTTSGVPTTYTAPASVPPANIALTATTVDGTPPASANATVTVTAHGFTATGNMETARELHTATLLGNGKVLLVGGNDSTGKALASAELFDPTSGTFTMTGSLGTAGGQTATLLTNGKVLVTGGVDANGGLLSLAEIFDPATGSFSPTGNMETTRSGHTATLLNNGKVLVAGGDPPPTLGGSFHATAELFDPATGTFTPTGNMETQHRDQVSGRAGHTATLLQNGKVLVVGGYEFFVFTIGPAERIYRASIQTAELFDPTSGTFTPTGSMETPRWAHTTTLLNDGTVLVTGGTNFNFQFGVSNDIALSTSERFDPAKGAFARTGSMTTPRTGHSATLRSDGTVLVAGGSSVVGIDPFGRVLIQSLDTAELFDPTSSTFTQTSGMETPRSRYTTTLLQDGRVLVTGGANFTLQSGAQFSTVLSSAELFH